jgi:hypothetical protein
MNLTQIRGLNDLELMSAYYWIAVRTTNETNSRRGLTKKTDKEETWIIETVAERFGLNLEDFKKELDK